MKNLILFTLIVIVLFCVCSREMTFYVAINGTDASPGTRAKPFATLDRAREAVRQWKRQGNGGSVQVLLRGGTYPITKTVVFGPEDSGEPENPVVYAAYPGEKVVFSGGRRIPPDRVEQVTDERILKLLPAEVRQKVRQVNLHELGIHDTGRLRNVGFARPYGPVWLELFVNKQPLQLARWPNHGYLPMGRVVDPGSVPRKGDYSNRGGTFHYNTNRPSRWTHSNDIRICGYFMQGWAEDAVRLARIDTLNKLFVTAGPTLYGFGSAEEKSIRRWYVYNLLEELDQPDEYYVDRQTGILYFIPPDTITSLEVSLLEESMIALEGASNIHIQNILFECSRGMGIYLERGENNRIENCVFRNLGIVAVCIGRGVEPFRTLMHDGSSIPVARKIGSLLQHRYRNTTFNRQAGKNNGVINCEIYNTGAGGVHLGGGDRLSLEPGKNFVENCVIHDFNRIEKSYRAGVDISGVGNRISHCEIYNAPSMAILLHGNDHIIEYNEIHHVCLTVDDQGALYYGRDPSERGHQVRYNYFHHIGSGRPYAGTYHGTSAVYHDDGACGMAVFGNVFYKAGYRTVLIGGGSDNPYTNNIFIESPIAIHVDNRLQRDKSFGSPGDIYRVRLAAVRYNQPPYSLKYPELARYWEDNPALPRRNTVWKNVFYRVKKVLNGDRNWLPFLSDNWITEDDPGFVAPEQEDFRLRADAPVFTRIPGFQPIPFEKIGVQKQEE